jgi:predicted CXXCH cytochrome family protein
MRGVLVMLVFFGLACAPGQLSAAGVASSAHNLSPTGPGRVKAATAAGVCEFCHIAHGGDEVAPLWSRRNPTAVYQPYSSSTAVARPGQPTGSSLLCLSCHDGTIALGEMINRSSAVLMSGGNSRMPPGRALTGTDLSDDHPISFQYSESLASENGELRSPGALGPHVKLDSNGELQCTSCHNAHDNSFGDFLVQSNQGSGLCLQCHVPPGWSTSAHSQSYADWNRRPPNPWPNSDYASVADNGCRNCHESHSADGPRLLRNSGEEDTCIACHNGNVASENVMALFESYSSHPVGRTAGVHDPAEAAVVDAPHVECADCHDPHSAGDSEIQVRGVSLNGLGVERSTYGYEVCLRCHGDSPNQPAPVTPRQLQLSNIRLEIQAGNPSLHPVGGVGRNANVPSLIEPLNELSIIDCIDCHNSSAAASAGGDGPEGPHGSSFAPLLVRNYSTIDNTVESPSTYALCYDCHSRDSILADESFTGHNLHVRGENTPCSVCHDAHGVSATLGNETNNSHLINFDVSVVMPNASGLLRFVDQGETSGSCDLACHGEDHNGYAY